MLPVCWRRGARGAGAPTEGGEERGHILSTRAQLVSDGYSTRDLNEKQVSAFLDRSTTSTTTMPLVSV